jgi:Tol biopolymer transport system component
LEGACASGYEIYTINSGGGSKFNVTDNGTDDGAPSYSPSGKKIAYQGYDAPKGDYEIYTIKPDGGGKVQLTDNSHERGQWAFLLAKRQEDSLLGR